MKEEWTEWQDALKAQDAAASEQEFGDYLFTLVELGRRKGIKANSALDFANQKFLGRFGEMENWQNNAACTSTTWTSTP